jgi:hypothetical protein
MSTFIPALVGTGDIRTNPKNDIPNSTFFILFAPLHSTILCRLNFFWIPDQMLAAAFALTQKTKNLLDNNQAQGHIRKRTAYPVPGISHLDIDQTAA